MVVHDSSKGWCSIWYSVKNRRLSETPDIQEERVRLQMYSTTGVVGDWGKSARDRQWLGTCLLSRISIITASLQINAPLMTSGACKGPHSTYQREPYRQPRFHLPSTPKSKRVRPKSGGVTKTTRHQITEISHLHGLALENGSLYPLPIHRTQRGAAISAYPDRYTKHLKLD